MVRVVERLHNVDGALLDIRGGEFRQQDVIVDPVKGRLEVDKQDEEIIYSYFNGSKFYINLMIDLYLCGFCC